MYLVSIIMTCHNGEKFLTEALSSVINQSYKNWELIFVNNSSTDSSKNIIHSQTDNRIKYFQTDKIYDLGKVRQLALDKCNGELITFLDVDDIWEKSKLYQQTKKFMDNEQIDILYCDYDFIGHQNIKEILRKKKFISGFKQSEIIKSYIIGRPLTAWLTLMIKSNILKRVHPIFDEKLHITSDFDLILNLSEFAYFDYIEQKLCKYRVHEDNTSKDRSKEMEELFYILKKYKNNKKIKKIFRYNHYYFRIIVKFYLYKLRKIFIKQWSF